MQTSGWTHRSEELAAAKSDDSLLYYIKMHRNHIEQLRARIEILQEVVEIEEREAARRGIDLNA